MKGKGSDEAPQLLHTHCKHKHNLGSSRSLRGWGVGVWMGELDGAAWYLFEQRHGELLVWDAVFGGADVLSALGADVEVDAHQKVLLT